MGEARLRRRRGAVPGWSRMRNLDTAAALDAALPEALRPRRTGCPTCRQKRA